MDKDVVLDEMIKAIDETKEGINQMRRAHRKLIDAETKLSVVALKCEIVKDEGNEKFLEFMEDIDRMRQIVTYILKEWPSMKEKPKTRMSN